MKVYVGADHAGYELKSAIVKHLQDKGIEVEDVGAHSLEKSDDYPKYAFALATKLLASEDDDRGILICGSGQGMTIAANRVRGIRAALAWDVDSAQVSREDDDSNVLSLPARFVDEAAALKMVDAWLDAEFKSATKYQRRLDEIEDIYG